MPDRPTPFELVFGTFRDRLALVGVGLTSRGESAEDRDTFLLQREVAELLRELRPEEGLGQAMGGLAALVHHAYLHWVAGEPVRDIGEVSLGLLVGPEPGTEETGVTPGSGYVRLPPLAVWCVLADGTPEPLDGWFVRKRGDDLEVLAVLGIRPGRPGFTAAQVTGPRPGRLARADGSALFAPITARAGAQAGIASVAGEDELLELAWRAEAAVR